MQYFGYLRRDLDENSYQFWLRKLNEFNAESWSFYLALLINTASLVLDIRLTAKCFPSGDKEKSANN